MAAPLPPFDPYDPASEALDSYLQRFNFLLEAHNLVEIADHRKSAIFLNYCSLEVFEMARALVAPMSVLSVPWDVLQSKLRDHYAPKLPRIASRYVFYHRNQAEGESINCYVVALRKAALHCEFKDLEDALLDRVVCGMRDVELQRCLLAKTHLTLQMALAEAQAAEFSSQLIRFEKPRAHQRQGRGQGP